MRARTLATLEVPWSSSRRTEGQCFAEFAKLRRLAEYPINLGRNLPFGHQALPPPGKKNHRSGTGGTLHKAGNLTAIYARHTQIRNHDREGFTPSRRGAERVDPGLASVRRNHLVTIALESLAERPEDQRVIIHNQNPQPRWNRLRRVGKTKIVGRSDRNSKT